jgi:hypothetical protein
MELLNPAALYAFLLLPLLLVPYLIRGRPRRLVFSSLLLLKEFSSRSSARPWGRLYLPPIFFLQLLLLALLMLALGEPVFSVHPTNIAVVLDNSASMQTLEGGKSRFQLAQDEAADLLSSFSARARVDLYLTVPRIERITGESLAPDEAARRIASLSPYDLAEPPVDYGAELARLAKEKGYERIFFLTDHPARGQSEVTRIVSIGRPRGNFAITSFHLARPSLASSELAAKVEVTNFSATEEKVSVVVKGSGKVLSARTVTVAAGRRAEASFENLPSHPYYEAEIQANDGLALDNRRFALPPGSKGLKILAISPRPEALSSLRSIPGVELKVISPQAYGSSEREGYGLELFHYSAPSLLPQSHALLILPPKENPLVAPGAALSRPVVSAWQEPHPLTRYINFTLFRPDYGRVLKPLADGEAVLESSEGPLAVGMEQKGFRYLALGFDPFPFLGRKNLPMSIFTLNLLQWFHEPQRGAGVATGEPLTLAAQQGEVLVGARGERYPLQAGSAIFSQTYYQGLYQLIRRDRREFLAVNFQDAKESDLSHPTPIQLTEEPELMTGSRLLFSLWPYLLFLGLVLLLLEWFFNPPVQEPARRAQMGPVGR